jgi:hypothetical protein
MCCASLGDVFTCVPVKHNDSPGQGQGKNPVSFEPFTTTPSKDRVPVADAAF